MTKSELISKLESIEGDPVILLAKDEEWDRLDESFGVEPVLAITDMFEWQAVDKADIDEYEEEQLMNAVVLWG
jgi:hypothetical protein